MAAATYYLGPSGGHGGNEKRMSIDAANQITKIQVRHRGVIDAIRIMFRRNGSDMSTDWWGGSGGQFSEFNLEANEFLKSIHGHYGVYENLVVVRSITFVSNKRKYGPFGTEEGIAFNLETRDGKIVGFAARTGGYVDSITVHAA